MTGHRRRCWEGRGSPPFFYTGCWKTLRLGDSFNTPLHQFDKGGTCARLVLVIA